MIVWKPCPIPSRNQAWYSFSPYRRVLKTGCLLSFISEAIRCWMMSFLTNGMSFFFFSRSRINTHLFFDYGFLCRFERGSRGDSNVPPSRDAITLMSRGIWVRRYIEVKATRRANTTRSSDYFSNLQAALGASTLENGVETPRLRWFAAETLGYPDRGVSIRRYRRFWTAVADTPNCRYFVWRTSSVVQLHFNKSQFTFAFTRETRRQFSLLSLFPSRFPLRWLDTWKE